MRIAPVLAVLAVAAVAVASATAGVKPQTLTAAGEGRRVFLHYNCYGCHGMYGGGGMGPSLRGGEADDLREAVLHGEDEGMRSYSAYLTSTDITNLIAYVKSMGTPSEPTFKDWWVDNPPK